MTVKQDEEGVNKVYDSAFLELLTTRTKKFENLAFSPFPNYSRFQQINKSKAVKKRKEEEQKMLLLQNQTIQKSGSLHIPSE